jgi:endonuclease/exonuclease/phosphatase family metal-dependent hydrolase
MHFRLMTWNMHKGIGGVDRRYDIDRVIKAIGACNPDIVHLQEVDDSVPRSSHHRQADILGAALDYEHRFFQPNVRLRRGHYGNAILSRFPLDAAHSLNLTIPFKKRRGAQIATLRLPAGRGAVDVHLVNMHLGLIEFEQGMQLRRILRSKHITALGPEACVIIAGDMNDLFGRLGRRLLVPAGFHCASAAAKTFPAFLPMRALDQIHYRGRLRPRRCFVEHNKIAREASDHLPLLADFEIVPG